MAESDVRREGENESRLRQARRAPDQPSSLSETGEPARFGPGPIDVDSRIRNVPFAGRLAQRFHDRGITNLPDAPSEFLDADAAASRRAGVERMIGQEGQAMAKELPGAKGALDRATGAAIRQQRLENQLNRARRPSGAGKAAGASSVIGKGSPVGAGLNAVGGGRVKAVMMAAQALQKGGLDKAEVQQTFGRGCVKMLWQNLWFTFGHSIYFLAIIFLATSQSRYARKWFPQIGEEWFPPDLIKKIPKAAMVPLKLAELVGLAFVLFWVLLLDLACLGMFAFFLGLILSAAGAV